VARVTIPETTRRRARQAGDEACTRTAPAPDRLLPWLLLATFAAKAVVLAQLGEHPLLQPEGGLDSQAYVELGRRVAGGDLLLGPEPYFVAPLYAYFLGAVFALTGGSLLVAKLAQIVLGTAAVALVHATARRFGGTLAARSAAVLAALTGVFTFSEVTLLQSALDPFLAALVFHLLARAQGDGVPRRSFVAGLACGALALNRPNALGLAFGLTLLLALAAVRGRSRERVFQAAALLAGTALAIAPVTLRNLAVSGEPILIASHGGLNFFIGNHAGADGTYRRVPGVTPNIAGQARDAQRLAEEAAGRGLSARAASAWFTRRALEWMRAEPAAALRLQARKLAYVFNAAELPLNFSFAWYAREEATLLRALVVGPWLLLPLGLVGLAWRARDGDAAFRLWAAGVPIYGLSVAAFFVAGRYRQPLLVPLAVGAGLAVERAWPALRARDGRVLAPFALALLALATATNRDLGFDDGREAERAALVEWLADHGRLDDARARLDAAPPASRSGLLAQVALALDERAASPDARPWLERALSADPSRADVALALGRLHLAQGDAARAVDPLRVASQHAPNAAERAQALEKLGVALGLLDRPDQALAALNEACRLAPREASAHLNRAVVLTQSGRFDEARAAVDDALRLKPDYDQARRLRDELARPARP
jgi:Flp pilus assembly protein TadD